MRFRQRSVADGYASGRNSLNAIRLALAMLVIVSHAWPLNGHGDDPKLLGVTYGTWAVAGFFGISGYLIAVSREHHGPVPFLTRRVLRIYPGFWVVLMMTAFVFAPIAARVGSGSWHPGDGVRYVRHTFTLQMHVWNVGDTLHNAPYPLAWDGSLWTLRYEFLCYLIVGVLLTVTRLRHGVLWVAFALAAAHSLWRGDSLSNFAAVFVAGSIIAVNRRRIPLAGSFAVAAAALTVAGALLGHVEAIGGFGVAYLLLWLGAVLPLRGFGQRNDLSYGIYIFGFPAAQLLVLAGARTLPVGVAAPVDVIATVPLAAASWFVIERPAQRLAPVFDRWWRSAKSLRVRGRAEPAPAAEAAVR